LALVATVSGAAYSLGARWPGGIASDGERDPATREDG
jgi:hypothetical protein